MKLRAAENSLTSLHNGNRQSAARRPRKPAPCALLWLEQLESRLLLDGTNNPPIARNDVVEYLEEARIWLLTHTVLENDIDPDLNSLTALLVAGPEHGSLTLNPDGTFEYQPNLGWYGTDRFLYQANDGIDNGNIARVLLIVNPYDTSFVPLPVRDKYVVEKDHTLMVSASEGLLPNDLDADFDTLSVVSATAPLHGILTVSSDGSFAYTPEPAFVGLDSARYTIRDGITTATGLVEILVRESMDPVVAVNDHYTFNTVEMPWWAGGSGFRSAKGVLANDRDEGGEPLTWPFSVTLTQGPEFGTVDLSWDGSFTYSPYPQNNENYPSVSFTYRVTDGDGNSATATAHIDFYYPTGGENPEVYTTDQAATLSVPAPGVLSNDETGYPWFHLQADLVEPTFNGSLTLNADGSFTYVPDGTYFGPDSFAYHRLGGASQITWVTINVTEAACGYREYVLNPNDATLIHYPYYRLPWEYGVHPAGISLVDAIDEGVATHDGDATFIHDYYYMYPQSEYPPGVFVSFEGVPPFQDFLPQTLHRVVARGQGQLYVEIGLPTGFRALDIIDLNPNAWTEYQFPWSPPGTPPWFTQSWHSWQSVNGLTAAVMWWQYGDDNWFELTAFDVTAYGVIPSVLCTVDLVENSDFVGDHSESIIVPNNPGALEFRFKNLFFDTTDAVSMNDSFEAALVDQNGRSVVGTIVGNRDAFFNFTEGEPVTVGRGAQYTPAVDLSSGIVTVDISHLEPGTELKFIARLVNNDDDTNTRVTVRTRLHFVRPSPIVDPSTVTPPFPQAPPHTIDFAALSDVTPSMAVTYHRTTFDERADLLSAVVDVANVGTYPVRDELIVGVRNISDGRVEVSGADGVTPDGMPYFDLSHLAFSATDGLFQPNEIASSVFVTFANPAHVQFDYELVFLGELNQPPAFTSTPVAEVLAGKRYAYAAVATDPDGDLLTYSLVTGPSGMTIDGTSGLVTWNTTNADLGRHRAAIRVQDGYGGSDEQDFTISVVEPPPNRPPIFTSDPVVDAYVSSAYVYLATATDADDDPLSFSVAVGPAGLAIDSQTGVVTWTPPENFFNQLVSVSLVVADGNGGDATQDYKIFVHADPANHDPIIVSVPRIRFDISGSGAGTSGAVDPQAIALKLDSGESATRTVSLTVGKWVPKVDVFLLIDNTGSFEQVTPSVYNSFPSVIQSLGELLPKVSFGFGVGRFEEYSGYDESVQARPFFLSQPILSPSHSCFNLSLNYSLHRSTPGGGGDWPETDIEALFQLATGEGFDGNGDGDTTDSGLVGAVSTQIMAGDSGDVPAFRWGDFIPPNRPPVALPNQYEFDDDLIAVELPVLSNDCDPDDDALQISAVTAPQYGTAVIGPNADMIIYTPAPNMPSADSFTYTVADTSGATTTAQVIMHRPGDGFGGVEEDEPDPAFDFDAIRPAGVLGGAGFRPGALPVVIHATDDGTVYQPDGNDSIVGRGGVSLPLSRFTHVSRGDTPGGRGATIQQAIDELNRIGAVFVGMGNTPAGIFCDVCSATDPTRDPRQLLEAIALATGSVNRSSQTLVSRMPDDPIAPGDPLYFVISGSDQANGEATGDLGAQLAPAILAAITTLAFDIDVIVTDPTVGFENLTGIVPDVEPEETASFDVRFTGDGDAHWFDLQFIRAGTGVVLGTIPVTINYEYLYDADAVDPDEDVLTYELVGETHGATIDPETGDMAWTPPNVGEFEFTLRVTDGRGGEATQTWTVAVTAVGDQNQPPVIDPMPDQDLTVDRPFALNVRGHDPDQDPLSFFFVDESAGGTPIPQGASIDRKTGRIEWTPTSSDVGVHTLTVSVIDGHGGRATAQFRADVRLRDPDANGRPSIVSQPITSASVDRAYRYVVEATDPDGDPLTFALPLRPAGMVIDPDTGAIIWRPTADDLTAGSRSVVVRVRDSQGAAALQAFTIRVWPTNEPPVITSQPIVRTRRLTEWTYPLSARDPDGNPITFSFARAPRGMFIDSANIARWTPRNYGKYNVTVRADDGRGGIDSQSFVLTVTDHVLPRITSTPKRKARLNGPYTYQVVATPSSGLVFQLREWPTGQDVHLDPDTGLLTWNNPAPLGTYRFVISAMDAAGDGVLQGFVVRVVDPATNRPPVVTSPAPPNRVCGGLAFLHQIEATDPDDDLLAYSLVSAPPRMSINGSGLIRWATRESDINDPATPYTYTVRITDDLDAWVERTYSLNVVDRIINSAPVITSRPVTNALADYLYSYDAEASDADGDTLTWRLERGPAGMEIDRDTGLVRWAPFLRDAGEHTVVISVSDGFDFPVTQQFVVTARAVNRPPRVDSYPPTQSYLNERYVYEPKVVDPDGDPLRFSLDAASLARGMSIDAATGKIQWTPTAVGTVRVRLTALDQFDFGVVQVYDLHVINPGNRHPRIVSIGPLVAEVDQTYVYDVDATDPDGDVLTYGVTVTPTPLNPVSINATTGLIEWVPDGTEALQRFRFQVTAIDPGGLGEMESFEVRVRPPDQAPYISSTPPTTVVARQTYRYDVRATDPDDDEFIYVLDPASLERGMRIDRFGRITWVTRPTDIGTYSVIVGVFGFRLGTAQQYTLSVVPDTESPAVEILASSNPADKDALVVIWVRATDNVAVSRRELTLGAVQK